MIRVTCIRKAGGDHYDQHEAIQDFGWTDVNSGQVGTSSLAEMVKFLENGGAGYVQDDFLLSKKAFLVVRTSRFGNKYVKTITDGRDSDNLLHLRECSVSRY